MANQKNGAPVAKPSQNKKRRPRLYFAAISPPYIAAASAIHLAAAFSLGKLIVLLVLVAGLGNGFPRLEDSGSPDSDLEVSISDYFAQSALASFFIPCIDPPS